MSPNRNLGASEDYGGTVDLASFVPGTRPFESLVTLATPANPRCLKITIWTFLMIAGVRPIWRRWFLRQAHLSHWLRSLPPLILRMSPNRNLSVFEDCGGTVDLASVVSWTSPFASLVALSTTANPGNVSKSQFGRFQGLRGYHRSGIVRSWNLPIRVAGCVVYHR